MSTPQRTRKPGHSPSGHAHRVAHLIAGGLDDLIEIETLLVTLPICATGRVFIEVDSADQVSHLEAPSRMVVTWLVRAERSGAPGSGLACAPGQALTRAVTAWAGEMLCSEDPDSATPPASAQIWLAGHFTAVADTFDYLVDDLGVDPRGIRTPARFGLGRAR